MAAPNSTARKPPALTTLALAGALLLAVGAVYWNSRNAPFIFDDFPAVVRNSTIRDLGRIGAVLSPPLDGAGVTGRPLVNLSYAIDYALHGNSAQGYHLGSVLLHAFAALAFFGVLRRAFLLPALRARWGEDAAWRAAGIALVWAVHPLLTESVVCIAQRNEVLVGLFYFLTFYGFIRSVEDGAAAHGWQLASVAACWLGMASKEVMATAPVLVLLFDRLFVAESWTEIWRRRKGYHAAMAAAWLLLAWLMLQTKQRDGIVGFGLGMSGWDYLVTQGRAITMYLRLSLWPHPLVVDYGPAIFPLREVWAEVLLVAGLGLATLWALGRGRAAGFLGAWFFVILAPSSSFVPLTTQTMAEHRMYLPLAAVVTGLLLAAGRILPRWAIWLPAGLAVLAGVFTFRRNGDYLDERHFWTDTLVHQPDNARVHASLGYYYMRHRQWPEAIAAYEKAVSLRENFADAHSDLGSLLLEVGRIDEAVAHGRTAVQMKPADPVLHFNFGLALEKVGDARGATDEWETALRLRPMLGAARRKLGAQALQNGRAGEAAEHFQQAAAADPTDVEAWAGWGQALTTENQLPEAVACFEAALRLEPGLAELHYNLGNVWLQMNRPEEASRAYAEAVRLKPEWAAARHNLALALVRLGRAAEAVPHYERVLRQLPDSAQVRYNLALALAQAGRPAEAIAQDEIAVKLAPDFIEAREHLAQLKKGKE